MVAAALLLGETGKAGGRAGSGEPTRRSGEVNTGMGRVLQVQGYVLVCIVWGVKAAGAPGRLRARVEGRLRAVPAGRV